MIGRGRSPLGRLSIAKPVKLGPEHNVWFWNPNRVGVKSCPEWFESKIAEVDSSIAVTWNPIIERWLVWAKAPRLQHPICQGWKLLFIHWDEDHSYLPLDERLLARLYASSVDTFGSAKRYFDHVASIIERDREKAEKQFTQDSIDRMMPFYNHAQISVSMAGKSSGSKFARYHS